MPLFLGLGLLAAAFRAVHLGTPSLWWDEIVEIDTATRPAAALVGTVKWAGVGARRAMRARCRSTTRSSTSKSAD